jgi:hypothetical protein
MPYQSDIDIKSKKRILRKDEIDLDELERVAKLHATRKDIAEWFRCSTSTLDNDPYYSVIIKAQNETKQRLKQKALQRALQEDSDMMLKFCLTNYCKWSDKQVTEVTNELGEQGFTITVIPPAARPDEEP